MGFPMSPNGAMQSPMQMGQPRLPMHTAPRPMERGQDHKRAALLMLMKMHGQPGGGMGAPGGMPGGMPGGPMMGR